MAPEHVDLRVTSEGAPEYWAEEVMRRLRPPIFDPEKPTALFLGRYQPFHDGHKGPHHRGPLGGSGRPASRCATPKASTRRIRSNFEYVRARIEHGLREFQGRFVVVSVPNITNVFYGREVGYVIERIDLDATIEEVSATEARKKLTAR